MDKKVITIEEAVSEIDGIIDRVEGDFHSANHRFPSYLNEEDYVLLGNHLSIDKEVEKRDLAICGEDLARRLVVRYLDREGFFDSVGEDKTDVVTGMIGRLGYNPSFREYRFRIDALNRLIEQGVLFPTRAQEAFQTIGKINKVCFLPSFSPKYTWGAKECTPNENDPTGEKYEGGFRHLGTHFVNPMGILKHFEKYSSYEEFVKRWEPLKDVPFKSGCHNSFYE